MSYITLEDDTGSMELLAFQRALDTGGRYIKDAAALLVQGRISLRDEKEPQLMVDAIRPLSDLESAGPAEDAGSGEAGGRTIYLRLPGRDHPLFRRVCLLLTMFPGQERMVVYFQDTKKRMAASCRIHPALLDELRERAGMKTWLSGNRPGRQGFPPAGKAGRPPWARFSKGTYSSPTGTAGAVRPRLRLYSAG